MNYIVYLKTLIMKHKRLVAYIIDFLILSIIITIIPINDDIKKLNKDININNNLMIEKEIAYSEYFENYKILKYELDKEFTVNLMFNLFLTLIYFVILPFKLKGQTIGMKITKIKINSINIKKLLYRTVIINFTGYMFINLVLILLLNKKYYFYGYLISTLLAYLLVFISAFMVLYRQDKKGLQDVLTKTKMIKN